jgi:hypothetical protein
MTESSRKRRTAPKVLGALAAAGALGLTVPSAIASACPEHDAGSDSASNAGAAGASSSSANTNSASNAGAAGSSSSSANANSTRTRNGSKTGNTGNVKSNPVNEPAQEDSVADCSAGSGQLRSGACSPDPV